MGLAMSTLKKAAREGFEEWFKEGGNWIKPEESYEWTENHLEFAARAAWDAALGWQLDQAMAGFQEYFKSLPEDTHDWFALKGAWQAARLSAEKEIQQLREDLDWATYYIKGCALYANREKAVEIRKRHNLDEV